MLLLTTVETSRWKKLKDKIFRTNDKKVKETKFLDTFVVSDRWPTNNVTASAAIMKREKIDQNTVMISLDDDDDNDDDDGPRKIQTSTTAVAKDCGNGRCPYALRTKRLERLLSESTTRNVQTEAQECELRAKLRNSKEQNRRLNNALVEWEVTERKLLEKLRRSREENHRLNDALFEAEVTERKLLGKLRHSMAENCRLNDALFETERRETEGTAWMDKQRAVVSSVVADLEGLLSSSMTDSRIGGVQQTVVETLPVLGTEQ